MNPPHTHIPIQCPFLNTQRSSAAIMLQSAHQLLRCNTKPSHEQQHDIPAPSVSFRTCQHTCTHLHRHPPTPPPSSPTSTPNFSLALSLLTSFHNHHVAVFVEHNKAGHEELLGIRLNLELVRRVVQLSNSATHTPTSSAYSIFHP